MADSHHCGQLAGPSGLANLTHSIHPAARPSAGLHVSRVDRSHLSDHTPAGVEAGVFLTTSGLDVRDDESATSGRPARQRGPPNLS